MADAEIFDISSFKAKEDDRGSGDGDDPTLKIHFSGDILESIMRASSAMNLEPHLYVKRAISLAHTVVAETIVGDCEGPFIIEPNEGASIVTSDTTYEDQSLARIRWEAPITE